ncbi:MAG: DUF5719 family protein [Candidatus Geothermincolia bacterium]
MGRVTSDEPGGIRTSRARTIGLAILFLTTLALFSNPFFIKTAKAQNFDNARIADAGLAELGTTRPTGWDQPGECIKSVQRWVAAAGGYFGYGGVISGYTNSGAVQVSAADATKGDVVQWTTGDDNDWSRPHTVCIVENYGNGRYWIVQSNWESAGLVSQDQNWDPDPAHNGRPGWYATYWRFGNVTSLPPVSGGHDVVGATTPATTFYFAEGTCRPGFNPYFCIQNPGTSAAEVVLTYMKGDGTKESQEVTVPRASRVTIAPREKLGEADDAAHDFSTKVQSTNRRQIVVERPVYFNYKGFWTGGHDIVGATSPATSFYFAEGTTRPGFDTYFCIQNPGETPAAVALTYMMGNGKAAAQNVTLPAGSRSTVHPADVLGSADDAAHDFSCRVTSTNGAGIVVERPMYFSYKGTWTGGSDVAGASAPSKSWYFAEGTTRPGFDTYLTLLNCGPDTARVTVTYLMGDGATRTQSLSVLPNTRGTLHPSDVLGSADDAAHDFSCSIESTDGGEIVAERAMYFDYKGWDGGHAVMGATAPAAGFYFAEGTCRPNFDPYFCIQNPGDSPAEVTLTYMKADGSTATDKATVPKRSRVTVSPRTKLGSGDDSSRDFSTTVACTNGQQIVVERSTYFGPPAGESGTGCPDPLNHP